MSTLEKIAVLKTRNGFVEQGGVEEVAKKQHQEGKLTARERLDRWYPHFSRQ